MAISRSLKCSQSLDTKAHFLRILSHSITHTMRISNRPVIINIYEYAILLLTDESYLCYIIFPFVLQSDTFLHFAILLHIFFFFLVFFVSLTQHFFISYQFHDNICLWHWHVSSVNTWKQHFFCCSNFSCTIFL